MKFHYQYLKGWLPQKCELESFVFQKVLIWQQLLANQLRGIEYNFRCLKRFFRKVRRELRSAFFFKLRFLKVRLLVTWLKCLLNNHLHSQFLLLKLVILVLLPLVTFSLLRFSIQCTTIKPNCFPIKQTKSSIIKALEKCKTRVMKNNNFSLTVTLDLTLNAWKGLIALA